MKLSDLSEDERAVYLAAFGAFVGSQSSIEGSLDRPKAAHARGLRAVRWLRMSQREELEKELARAGHVLNENGPGF